MEDEAVRSTQEEITELQRKYRFLSNDVKQFTEESQSQIHKQQ